VRSEKVAEYVAAYGNASAASWLKNVVPKIICAQKIMTAEIAAVTTDVPAPIR
jgi:hypothetical protein